MFYPTLMVKIQEIDVKEPPQALSPGPLQTQAHPNKAPVELV